MADIVTDISVNKNWQARKGYHNPFTFTFTNNASAFNISGYTFSLQVRRFGSTTNLINLTQGSGLTNGGATGVLTGQINAAATSSMSANEYYWQLTVVQPDTFSYVLFNGTFILNDETYTGTLTSAVSVAVTLTGTDVNVSVSVNDNSMRVYQTTSTATLTPNVDSYDASEITAQAQALVIANPTGTPSNFQGHVLRIADNGTARAISFGNAYVAYGSALPTTTTLGKTMYIPIIYNSTDSKWNVLPYQNEQ